MKILALVSFEGEDLQILRNTENIHHPEISKSGMNKLYKMREVVESGIGQNIGRKGSGLWLINGVTTYFQNVVNYKNDETKFDSIQNGTAAKALQRAYKLMFNYR